MSSLKKIVWIKIFIVILFSFGSNIVARAQTCMDVLQFCPTPDSIYNRKVFARAYKLTSEKPIRFIHVFYSGSYYLSFCKKDDLVKTRMRIIDHKSNVVLWDNIKSNYRDNYIKTYFGSTKRVIIELNMDNSENSQFGASCVGLSVWSKKKPKVVSNVDVPDPELP